MIGASPSVKVFAYTGPVDMRKGFDGLFGLVKTHLGRDPLSGDLFVFMSRNRKRAKVLLWDGTGLCLYAKRLERGQFANLWSDSERAEIELTTAVSVPGLTFQVFFVTCFSSPPFLPEPSRDPRSVRQTPEGWKG